MHYLTETPEENHTCSFQLPHQDFSPREESATTSPKLSIKQVSALLKIVTKPLSYQVLFLS